ncbi:hypothetical protein ACTXT7_001815 [Hymenolepis weldensis]
MEFFEHPALDALQEVMELLDKFPKVHRPLQMHLTDAIMNLKSVYTMHEQENINPGCGLQCNLIKKELKIVHLFCSFKRGWFGKTHEYSTSIAIIYAY